MNINYTIFGQMIAFAIFVVFCMKFVWPPLMQALEERQRKISDGLNAAEKAKADLADAQAQVKQEIDAAKAQAAQIIEQANRRATQLVEEARTQATAEGERIRQQSKEAVDAEINAAREQLRQEVAVLAVAGAEKILNQQVDAQVHNAMLTKLAEKL